MNSVGIDVSKGKSMIAVMRPFGEVVYSPFEVPHTASELSDLAKKLKSLDGETKVVMEATGNYHLPIAMALYEAGIYVSIVNPMLIHDYRNDTLRRAKTDRKDAVKLANYGLDKWIKLTKFAPEDETRAMLKYCYRLYQQSCKVQTTLKNNLIALTDSVFPNENRIFTSHARADGSEKWVDFLETFWHSRCVSDLTPKVFEKKYKKWCNKLGYKFSVGKAAEVYAIASTSKCILPKAETTHILVIQAVSQLKATSASLAELRKEMQHLANMLPEYPVIQKMYGVGPILGPQLLAEIGDVRRFYSKKALVAFAGLDAPPNDSGIIVDRHKGISKIGSAALRRTLFLIMGVYLQNAPVDEPVYQFMDKKRAEGKPFKVYMMASANKFLRIYYASVKAYLTSIDEV